MELMLALKLLRIFLTALFRRNRLNGCPLLTEKDLKKQGHWSFDYHTDVNIRLHIVKWFEKKICLSCFNIFRHESRKDSAALGFWKETIYSSSMPTNYSKLQHIYGRTGYSRYDQKALVLENNIPYSWHLQSQWMVALPSPLKTEFYSIKTPNVFQVYPLPSINPADMCYLVGKEDHIHCPHWMLVKNLHSLNQSLT